MKNSTKIVIALLLGVIVFQILKKKRMITSISNEPKASAKGGVECMCRDKWGRYNINRCPSSKYKDCEQCCSHYGKISDNEKI